MRTDDRERASQWARELLASPSLAILDTETTGLGYADQVVQIGIIDWSGAPLMDMLVKPTCRIQPAAMAIHGITDAMVADAPSFAVLLPELRALLVDKRLAIYNAKFDIRLLRQSAAASGALLPILTPVCVMQQYSRWVGEWSYRHRDYRWQPLPGGDHTAIGDARAALAVIRRMAEWTTKET